MLLYLHRMSFDIFIPGGFDAICLLDILREGKKKSNLDCKFDIHSFSRYLFALQIKRDLQMGALLCSDNTAALLASYIVQGNNGSPPLVRNFIR